MTTLPPGVTLQQIAGGPNYYTNNGFTSAANAGWDSPNFFPIGPWLDMLITQSDATRWHDLGWNTAYRNHRRTAICRLRGQTGYRLYRITMRSCRAPVLRPLGY